MKTQLIQGQMNTSSISTSNSDQISNIEYPHYRTVCPYQKLRQRFIKIAQREEQEQNKRDGLVGKALKIFDTKIYEFLYCYQTQHSIRQGDKILQKINKCMILLYDMLNIWVEFYNHNEYHLPEQFFKSEIFFLMQQEISKMISCKMSLLKSFTPYMQINFADQEIIQKFQSSLQLAKIFLMDKVKMTVFYYPILRFKKRKINLPQGNIKIKNNEEEKEKGDVRLAMNLLNARIEVFLDRITTKYNLQRQKEAKIIEKIKYCFMDVNILKDLWDQFQNNCELSQQQLKSDSVIQLKEEMCNIMFVHNSIFDLFTKYTKYTQYIRYISLDVRYQIKKFKSSLQLVKVFFKKKIRSAFSVLLLERSNYVINEIYRQKVRQVEAKLSKVDKYPQKTINHLSISEPEHRKPDESIKVSNGKKSE